MSRGSAAARAELRARFDYPGSPRAEAQFGDSIRSGPLLGCQIHIKVRSIQTFNGQATARMLQPMVAVSSCRVSTPAHIHVSPQPATRVQSLSHAALLDLAASFAFRSAEEQAHERGEQKAREQAIVTGPEQVGGECLAAGLYRNSSKARSRQTPVFDSRNTGDLAPGCGCH
ncbi:hypothetical protein TgHK011_006085 [Trichoderma gracile]|nr:hypothetical protein TgHK011_006085 [Trichoderma gracile]